MYPVLQGVGTPQYAFFKMEHNGDPVALSSDLERGTYNLPSHRSYFLDFNSNFLNFLVTSSFLRYLLLQVLIALGLCKDWYYTDHGLWKKIASNEYRRCAVVESYESIRHVLKRILREDSGEYQMFQEIFEEITKAIKEKQFVQRFSLKALPNIHSRLVQLINVLMKRPLLNDLQKA